MRRVRAYSRDERKRLIIHVMAEAIRSNRDPEMTCAGIARAMDIVPSTKLRSILAEMVAAETLIVNRERDAGIAGFRLLYSLNYAKPAFDEPHSNRKAAKRERTIRLNTSKGMEVLTLS